MMKVTCAYCEQEQEVVSKVTYGPTVQTGIVIGIFIGAIIVSASFAFYIFGK